MFEKAWYYLENQMADRGNRGRGGNRGASSQRGGQHRGNPRGGRGRGAGRGSGGRGGHTSRPTEKRSVMEFSQYLGKKVIIKFTGGREVSGILKGSDPLVNIVLDDTIEFLRDPVTMQLTEKTRKLGKVVCRGTSVLLVSPADGFEQLQDNPFLE